MAKIGVITYSNTKDNYGQVLQYLAIQEYLKLRGHDPILLRLKPVKTPFIRSFLLGLCHSLKNFFKPKQTKKNELTVIYQKWAKSSERNDKLHPRFFEDFRVQQFKIVTLEGYDDAQIDDFDGFAIGSDQIWSYVSSWNFLGFVPKGKPRFTIAPSTGNKKFTQEQIQNASNYLSNFSFVTCREDSGIDLCNAAGYKNALKLLDPTFLIDKSNYNGFAQNNYKPKHPYVFVYLLGVECEMSIDKIYEFAAKHGLDVKYVASQGREDSYRKEWATVPEWIAFMKESQYVITNSYHGMALSIIYGKQFLVLPIIGITSFMNERITALAETFNLQDRICKASLEELFMPINYQFSRMIIEKNIDTLNKEMSKIDY